MESWTQRELREERRRSSTEFRQRLLLKAVWRKKNLEKETEEQAGGLSNAEVGWTHLSGPF